MRQGSGLPDGFERTRQGRLSAVVRSDLRQPLLRLLDRWGRGDLPAGRALTGGRGGVEAFSLAGGIQVVLRPYRRGGLLARFNRDLYFGWRPRPFRELVVTETLRRLGVPTVEPLAAAALRLVPGVYRGALVTREVEGAENLWAHLRRVPMAERERACVAAAAATIRMHDAGGIHPDLNLQNYLVREAGGGIEALVIDLDKARIGTVSTAERRQAFERICRSIRRLDREAEVLNLASVEALHRIATVERERSADGPAGGPPSQAGTVKCADAPSSGNPC